MLRNKYVCPEEATGQAGELLAGPCSGQGDCSLCSGRGTLHFQVGARLSSMLQVHSLYKYVNCLNNVLSAMEDLIELLRRNCYWYSTSLSYVSSLSWLLASNADYHSLRDFELVLSNLRFLFIVGNCPCLGINLKLAPFRD
jgi:hypothetical protein